MYQGEINYGDTILFTINGRKLRGKVVREGVWRGAFLVNYGDGFNSWVYRSEILEKEDNG